MKFKVGEICECKDAYGALFSGWRECEIMPIVLASHPLGEWDDYLICVQGLMGGDGTYLWGIAERDLRKKRPPQQDNLPAEESFKDLMKQLNREEVRV